VGSIQHIVGVKLDTMAPSEVPGDAPLKCSPAGPVVSTPKANVLVAAEFPAWSVARTYQWWIPSARLIGSSKLVAETPGSNWFDVSRTTRWLATPLPESDASCHCTVGVASVVYELFAGTGVNAGNAGDVESIWIVRAVAVALLPTPSTAVTVHARFPSVKA
jgi:hypothetical protein